MGALSPDGLHVREEERERALECEGAAVLVTSEGGVANFVSMIFIIKVRTYGMDLELRSYRCSYV